MLPATSRRPAVGLLLLAGLGAPLLLAAPAAAQNVPADGHIVWGSNRQVVHNMSRRLRQNSPVRNHNALPPTSTLARFCRPAAP